MCAYIIIKYADILYILSSTCLRFYLEIIIELSADLVNS